MTRDEMLERISSTELTAWLALYAVEAEEAEHQRHLRESKDGQVFDDRFGREEPDDDDD